MCGESKQQASVLKDRTKGLDVRGNVVVNTLAESRWAVETLDNMDANSVALMTKELREIRNDIARNGLERHLPEFCTAYDRGFRTAAHPPNPKDITKLMLGGDTGFKKAVDTLGQCYERSNPDLFRRGRRLDAFRDRGRQEVEQGLRREHSFRNPHAGIADQASREPDLEDRFDADVPHGKALFKGKPGSQTYQQFQRQGMPFIGGASGSIHTVVMRWEKEQPLDARTQDEREKLLGLHMATLLAGGHHSAGEMLIAAKAYGYFANVEDPLANYPKAMKQLGQRLGQLGLPATLTPDIRKIWRDAEQAVHTALDKLEAAFAKTYDGPVLQAITREYQRRGEASLGRIFNGDLTERLDAITDEVEDQVKRQRLITDAARLLEELKAAAAQEFITQLDKNPFVKLSIGDTIKTALNKLTPILTPTA